MRIIYDSLGPDHIYPLMKADVARVRDHVPPDVWETIQYIRFGFSSNSRHTGRMRGRGRSHRIRVNFCLKRVNGQLQSPLACKQRDFVENVKRYGGKPDLNTRTIVWDFDSARQYAMYVLLHEIGHVVYAQRNLSGSGSRRGSSGEEDWCDSYSARLMPKIMAS
jgi:hypothetical protein